MPGVLMVKSGGVWVEAVPVGTPGAPGPQGTPGRPGARGQDGASGGPIPAGGVIGEFVRKSGLADFETEWTPDLPLGFVAQLPDPINMGASVAVPVNAVTAILTGDITLDPVRMYQIWAGIRAISDVGGDCNANITMTAGGVSVFDDYFTTSGAAVGLWGAWCQQLTAPGITYTAGGLLVPFVLNLKLSLAGTCYLPRITVIDVGAA